MTRTHTETPQWTAQELEQLVLEIHPKIAVFDCDGTIWSGDSGYGFMVWSLEEGLVSRSTSDWIDTRYRAYLTGKVSEAQICGEMVQIYAGLRELELQQAAARYIEKFVRPRVFPEIASLISALRAAGTELWAVSSTNKWVVAEGVRPFGIPESRVLAAEVRVEGGLISSEIVDVPTDAGKATALVRAGLIKPDAVFGNSVHDLAMLDLAQHAFPIDPSPALMEAATVRGWGYFQPAGTESAIAAVGGE